MSSPTDTDKVLNIAFSGSLDAYSGKRKKNSFSFLKKWFWTFNNDMVDASTRSAYYLIKAVRILKERNGISPDRIRFHFWGKINHLNIKQTETEAVADYFEFSEYLPKQVSLEKLASAELLFLPLEKSNDKQFRTLFIPGKIFEYLKIGKPILALCEASDCREIIEKSGLGICCEPDRPDEIANTLLAILQGDIDLKQIRPDNEMIASYDFRSKTAELAAVFDGTYVE